MSTDSVFNIRSAVPELKSGRSVLVRDFGDSMIPLIMNGETVRVEPFSEGELQKGDVVLAKVQGSLYLHKVTAVRGKMVQISNNRGKINGWTPLSQVYGKVIL
jgi:phage repressor protein C with HTH and peptisase S24 domain